MKDRLIKLLEAEGGFSRYMTDDERRAKLADHLISNGVIVPPCKVGDTIYVIRDMDNPARMMLECKVISISVEETSIHFQFQTFKKYLYRYGSFNIDDIGKTVFLTREEAEKALAERSENGK